MNSKIKSNYASLSIPFWGLEIPFVIQKGKLLTIEGLISINKESFNSSLEDEYYAEIGDDFINKIKGTIRN